MQSLRAVNDGTRRSRSTEPQIIRAAGIGFINRDAWSRHLSSPTLFGWILRRNNVTTVFYVAAGLASLTGLQLLLPASRPKSGDLR